MKQFFRYMWNKYNPFDLDIYYNKIQDGVKLVINQLDSIDSKIDREIKELQAEVALYKTMIHTIGDSIPDMMWLKSVDGKYLYANKSIKSKLLFDMNPIGKDDIEIATTAKKHFGDKNHTFGEKCSNSDLVILETLQPQRFLESGRLKGVMTYLEVYKAPLFIEGQLIGICGTSRDMTEYVEAYRGSGCDKCPKMKDIFSRYEYQNDPNDLKD